jgi:hypothetical protein
MDLKKLVKDYTAHTYRSLHGQVASLGKGIIEEYPIFRVVGIDSKGRELGEQIIDVLGNKSEIKDEDMLFALVVNEIVSELTRGKKTEEGFNKGRLLESIYKKLENPLNEYSFSYPVSLVSNISIDCELGGRDKLMLETLITDKKQYVVQTILMKGEIKAVSKNFTINRIEQHVKHFIGFASALGIALQAPQKISKLPEVQFEGGTEVEVDPIISSLSAITVFHYPDENENVSSDKILKMKEKEEITSDYLSKIKEIINSNNKHANKLKSAARLLIEALSSFDDGKTVAFALMSVEAVLLESSKKSDILARLREAVAYRLGSSPSNREDLRSNIDKLYSARSSYVHTGQISDPKEHREMALELAKDAIKKDILEYHEASS